MKSEIVWRGSKFTFDGRVRQHNLALDAGTASGGGDLGPTPKELVLAAICGCTGMDVIGLLKKAKVQLDTLKISAQAESTREHPRVFQSVQIIFEATGNSDLRDPLIDAVDKSESLFCGVSAMISKTCEINYQVFLNEDLIHEGKADFLALPLRS